MNSIYIIVTALATTALAKGSIECNFSEPSGAPCFGAVGQLLIFHLPNTANTDTKLKKDNQHVILKTEKKQIVIYHNEYVNRSELFTNGTFKLGYAMKKDSGDYLLEQFGSNGASLRKVSVHLEIQAPVSKPVVSQMCVSPEQMKINCSSEGEEVEFNLTLDDLSLMETRVDVKLNETKEFSVTVVTISLHDQLKGNLMCRVWNKVSREETVIHLTSCKAPVSKPVVSQMCLSPEQMNISCSSEGEKVEFILTLNGHLLMQTRGDVKLNETKESSVSVVTISLYGQLNGNLMCRVWNNVSRDETVIHLTSCKDFSSFSVMLVIASAVTLFLLVGLCLGIKILHNKRRPATVNKGNSEDEIIYTDVRVRKNPRTQKPNSPRNVT